MCLCHQPLLQKLVSHQHASLSFLPVLHSGSVNAEAKAPIELYDGLVPFKETSPGCLEASAGTNFWKCNLLSITSTFFFFHLELAHSSSKSPSLCWACCWNVQTFFYLHCKDLTSGRSSMETPEQITFLLRCCCSWRMRTQLLLILIYL